MKIKRTLGTGVASLGLVVGLAGFAGASSGTIDTTGPDSSNVVRHRVSTRVHVHNDNKVHVDNYNHQMARSGDAETEHNTRGGDARTGDASNTNRLNASVRVDNSNAGVGSNLFGSGSDGDWRSNNTSRISDTGPDSVNRISTQVTNRVNIENNNDLEVHNTNSQYASSGDAEVSDNTRGGDARTGDATNTNTTTLDFRVTN